MKHILIVNGPNLNMLGERQPEIYGNASFDTILESLRQRYDDIDIDYFQSNHEGHLIDRIQKAYLTDKKDAIILNGGGYSHTSVALADAVAAVDIPVVEVHLSNIYAREPFRHHSLLSPVCCGVIAGFGTSVYALAIDAIKSRL